MIKGQKYRRFKTVKTVPFHLFLTFKRNERVTNFSELLHRCVGMTDYAHLLNKMFIKFHTICA